MSFCSQNIKMVKLKPLGFVVEFFPLLCFLVSFPCIMPETDLLLSPSLSQMDSDESEKQKERRRSKPKHDQETTRTRGIESLPCEIMLYILSKLPLSSFLRFKYVCRAWKMLTEDSYLENFRNECLIFYSNSPIRNNFSFVDFNCGDYTNQETTVKRIQMPFCSHMAPELNVVGSCNGLLCLSDSENSGLYICNPFTGEYRQLPETNQCLKRDVVFGFGFHPRSKDYKVVKISYHWPQEGRRYRLAFMKSNVQIFTLGSSSWRVLGVTSHVINQWPGTQVSVNGRLHWETRKSRYHQLRDIVSFDLEDEKFREVPKPDSLVLRIWDYLVVLRNCLSVVLHKSYNEVEIWIMKEYDVKESWIKEFNIGSYIPKALPAAEAYGAIEISQIIPYSRERFERVLCMLESGEILVEYRSKILVLYDPQSGNFKDLMFKVIPDRFLTVVHLGNLNPIDTIISL